MVNDVGGESQGIRIPRPEKQGIGTPSAEVEKEFQAYMDKKYAGKDKRGLLDFRHKEVPSHLFTAEYNQGKTYESVIRSYFARESSTSFSETAHARFLKEDGGKNFFLSSITKYPEGNRQSLQHLYFEDGHQRLPRNYMRFSLRSAGMGEVIFVWDKNRLDNLHAMFDQDRTMRKLEALKKSPRSIALPSGMTLDIEYDEDTNTVSVTSKENDKVKRVIRIPVDIDVSDIKTRFTERLNLEDPYNADVDADYPWLQTDFEKVIGIKDKTP